MLDVGPKVDLARFRRGLSDAQAKQLPYAVSLAVNEVASRARDDLVASLKTTFDRPTPWTLNATYLKLSTKRDLRAGLGIREFAPKGTPAWKYLGPQRDGGARGQKRFERALAATNRAAPFAVPGPAARMDSYGNMSHAQLVQILSGVGAFSETGYKANATQDSSARKKRLVHAGSHRKASQFFVAHNKAGRPYAVFELKGKGRVARVLNLLDKAPTYSARWDPGVVVLSSAKASSTGAFERAWARALATAKP